VFVFIGQTDFKGWSEFVKWVFGIYAAGNVGEHVANKKEPKVPQPFARPEVAE